MNATKTKRSLALLTGAALLAPALLPSLATPARAADDKKYKTGAAVLGALAGYFVLQGKTVPGIVAGAGAYYAYKKSRDAKNDRYGSYDDYYGSQRDDRRNDSYNSRRGNRDKDYNPVYDDTDARNYDPRYNDTSNGSDAHRDTTYDDNAYDISGSDAFPDDLGYDSLKDSARPVLK
jgi:hypothetical protein